jgi:dextranase
MSYQYLNNYNKMRGSIILNIALLCGVMLISGCGNNSNNTRNISPTYGDAHYEALLKTDKVLYASGEAVTFTLTRPTQNKSQDNWSGNLKVRYTYLGQVINEHDISGNTWQWTPPTTDFRGYLAEVYETKDGEDIVRESIAIDVSSDWKKFPRYGFLSMFSSMNNAFIQNTVASLIRFNIKGFQF